MQANAAQRAYPRIESPVAPPRVKRGLSRRVRAQMQTLVVVCAALFFLGLGVMFYLFGNASIEFERNRKNMLTTQIKDAKIERDLLRNDRNKTASPYKIQTVVKDPTKSEYLVPPTEKDDFNL